MAQEEAKKKNISIR